MIRLRLTRFLSDSVQGSLGVWRVGTLEVFTIERPWADNTPFVSCIPVGTYEVQRSMFTRKDGTTIDSLEIMGVPGRYGIKAHPANRASELQGCIAPGLAASIGTGLWGVEHSRRALRAVLTELAMQGSGPMEIVIENNSFVEPPRRSGAHQA